MSLPKALLVVDDSEADREIIALTAGSITGFLSTRPGWLKAQRWLMGTVLAGFAIRMAFEAKRA